MYMGNFMTYRPLLSGYKRLYQHRDYRKIYMNQTLKCQMQWRSAWHTEYTWMTAKAMGSLSPHGSPASPNPFNVSSNVWVHLMIQLLQPVYPVHLLIQHLPPECWRQTLVKSHQHKTPLGKSDREWGMHLLKRAEPQLLAKERNVSKKKSKLLSGLSFIFLFLKTRLPCRPCWPPIM